VNIYAAETCQAKEIESSLGLITPKCILKNEYIDQFKTLPESFLDKTSYALRRQIAKL
jgi:hypothetical protein